MSFKAVERIRFLVGLASFLGILVKASCAGLRSFFLEHTQRFLTTRKTVVKKTAGRFSFALWSSSLMQP